MKKLFALLVAVVVLLGVLGVLLDFFAKQYTEEAIGDAITHRSKNIGYASASIDSFPFTWNLAKDGRVDHLTLKLQQLHDLDVAAPIDELDIAIDGLEMDKSSLFGESHVEIEHVDRVTVTALLSVVSVRDAAGKLGIDIGFGDNVLTVNGIAISVAMDGGDLVLSGTGLPTVRLPVPAGDASVLPCAPSPTIRADGIALSCQADHLPKIVVDAIGNLDLKQELGG